MTHQSQTSSEDQIPPQRAPRQTPPGCVTIAGMKTGWLYRYADRTILHQHANGPALPIGVVPHVLGRIVHVTDDAQNIRTEYLVRAKRQKRPRIITEDELDKGTWSAKCGVPRPTGADERHAYARLIREAGDKAPVIPARTYYNEAGDLVFPEAEAQTLGYRVLRGEEEAAREAWQEIGGWTFSCGKSALVIGAMMVGPVLDSMGVLAHMVNCYGPGQQGKSTILTIAAGCFGDIKPRRQQLMITWNSSKQGITQSLRQRGFLPLCMDEHSSSGRKIQESAREISQMVAGAIRAMGTADGSPRESDGFWHSVAVSSSNEPLKFTGQTEDLASRLQEVSAPFYPNKMVLPDGGEAPAGHLGAEHISKRLKRLAKQFGGWPLEWAVRQGMYRAENLEKIRELHLELCAKHRPAAGGIPGTIAELHMAWVVGAHMFGTAIGVPELGQVAEAEAVRRLDAAITEAAETNVPDGEKLWAALDALRIEAASFPEMEKLPAVAEEGPRRLRGFHRSGEGEWWVVDPVVNDAASQAGIDNVSAALRELDSLGVHIRGDGKHAKRQTPKALRAELPNAPRRMHCFDTRRADVLFASDEAGPTEFPCGPTPGPTPGPTGVGPQNGPLTCDGPTGPTGPTLELLTIPEGTGPTPGTHPGPTPAAPRVDVPPMPTEPPAPVFPEARMHQAGEPELDREWLALESRARGRTRSALRLGVLGNGRLLLPNHAPVAVPLPGSVDDVPALMRAYGLKTLYIHAEALAPMGLPTFEERRALGLAQEREAHGDVGYARPPGPQSPVAHPWATPGDASPIASMAPAALTAWMTLTVEDGDPQRRLSVAIPAYDNRFDKAKQPGRGGFGGAPTPEVLLDALMVFTASTAHGSAQWLKLKPYYLGPNRTAEDFAGGRSRTDVVCEAIRRREVPPAEGPNSPIVRQKWEKPAEEWSEAERSAAWVQEYDKTAAWLPAYSNVQLGVGEPTHATGDGIVYESRFAGYWRVAEVPGTRPAPGLPELAFRKAPEGGYWLATPSMDLLIEKFPSWSPVVLEAWYWQHSKRALEGFYKLLSASRNRIVAAGEAGRSGAKWAKQVNGRIYQSFWGYLGRVRGPQRDIATGGDYAADVYWRPDWSTMLLAHATANMYRNLCSYQEADGITPLYVYVDAVGFASAEADPARAKPTGMRLGSQGGTWTAENTVPLSAVLPAFEDPKKSAHLAVERYTEQHGEGH